MLRYYYGLFSTDDDAFGQRSQDGTQDWRAETGTVGPVSSLALSHHTRSDEDTPRDVSVVEVAFCCPQTQTLKARVVVTETCLAGTCLKTPVSGGLLYPLSGFTM